MSPFPKLWAAQAEAVSELYARRQEPPERFFSEAGRRRALASMASAPGDDGIAVVEIRGTLTKFAHFGPLGMRDYERAILAAAENPRVRALLLVIESPGGTIEGTPRLAGVVARVAKEKPVVAFADGLMASAAYWIASQASLIVAAPFAIVGSIGTLMVHASFAVMLQAAGVKVTMLTAPASTQKTEGNPFEDLPPNYADRLRAELGVANDAFIRAVRGRRPSLASLAFTGAAWIAETAPPALIDGIGEIEEALEVARLLAARRAGSGSAEKARAGAVLPARARNDDRGAEVRWRQLQQMRGR